MRKGEAGITTKADMKIFRLTQVCVLCDSGPGTGHVAHNLRYSHFPAENL